MALVIAIVAAPAPVDAELTGVHGRDIVGDVEYREA